MRGSLLNPNFMYLGREEVEIMNATLPKTTQKTRCPECSNYVSVKVHDNGATSGTCPICKATFYSKWHSPKERLIRVIKH